jgi:hypothetical protein
MIVFRKGRSMKQLKATIFTLESVDVSDNGSRWRLKRIPFSDMKTLRDQLPIPARPAYFALNGNSQLFIAPIPNRDYRAHIVATQLVEL